MCDKWGISIICISLSLQISSKPNISDILCRTNNTNIVAILKSGLCSPNSKYPANQIFQTFFVEPTIRILWLYRNQDYFQQIPLVRKNINCSIPGVITLVDTNTLQNAFTLLSIFIDTLIRLHTHTECIESKKQPHQFISNITNSNNDRCTVDMRLL